MLAGGGLTLAGYMPFSHALDKTPLVNLGIIGTGSRGAGLASIIQTMPDINLAACCDLLPFRLAAGMRYEPKIGGYNRSCPLGLSLNHEPEKSNSD